MKPQQQAYPPQQQQDYPPAPDYNAQPAPTPPYHAGNTTVVVTAPVFYGSFPITTVCNNCHENVTTVVTHEIGSGSWLLCLVLFLFTGMCCFLPFCISSMQDHVHTCPKCQHTIATKRLM
ncbi:LITAF domain-containing protein-like [Bolinopsis microptera]|uniref:LITAF domain-containing protein-like n=1 Tax=Bolinopsis microptera TaxID=2820187 RepID=UPI003078DD49